uniref:BACK domain-containing protein n=1 Tax=Panagrolaimus davidi TaxID=227884 RepID=A0A914PFW8_9BILA
MLDMAEFYQIEDLKQLCDKFLSKMELNISSIIRLFEISNKYSMIRTKKPIHSFIFQNFKTIFKSDEFLNAEKSIITEIITLGQTFAIKYEEMFQAAYEWSENRAIKKQKELSDENFNMNDAIKVEMQEFLPNIKFNQMEIIFFTEYVVKITNKNGQSIYGLLPKENNAVNVIKSLQDQGYICFYWKTNCEKPSTPSPLKKRIGAKCYLIYFLNGNICVKNAAYITNDHYLLAEMISETDFQYTADCKIEIV